MIVVITAAAALVFVSCLLHGAYRRRQRLDSAYTGSHRRSPDQQPTPTLRYAMATAGTHGLGMIRKSASG
jgi:hypothetical protein